MFSIQHHPMKILNLNVRTEKHGDEEKTAVDIKIGFDVPNSYLELLDGGLREALYERPDDPDLLGDDPEHRTHVRFPQLGTFKWAGEYESVGFHLQLGNGRGKGDLIFGDAKFGKLTLAPKEGGTCSCVARVQVLPTIDQTAKLVGLLKHQVPASIDMDEAIDAKTRNTVEAEDGDGDGDGDETDD